MNMLRFALYATLFLSFGSACVVAATPPQAVVADPISDKNYPATNRQLLIPSGGMGMNALLMRASGKSPKPTLLLLHGLPGNEQNLDLAQAVRRAGWNVLTMHYRGSWGSPGQFSIDGAIQDAEAAMAFLLKSENAAKYNIDPHRVVIAGHSMGGLAAALYASAHPDVAGLVLIDMWNAGADGKDLLAHPETLAALLLDLDDDLGNSLVGTDPARLAEEIKHHAGAWDVTMHAPALAIPPTLVIGATRGGGAASKALADAIRAQRKRNLTAISLDSDHAFSDRRIAVSSAVVRWLQNQAASRPSSSSR
jgi:pimeloyl-ACP methyl ester carboxylesterase